MVIQQCSVGLNMKCGSLLGSAMRVVLLKEPGASPPLGVWCESSVCIFAIGDQQPAISDRRSAVADQLLPIADFRSAIAITDARSEISGELSRDDAGREKHAAAVEK